MAEKPAESEEGLLARFRRGDEEAFGRLFDRHLAILERVLGRAFPPWLRRRVAVSDLIQETRLVAFGRREDFESRGPDSFRNWVLKIGSRKLDEAIRRHAGAARRAVRLEVTRGRRIDTDMAPASGPTPSAAAVSLETAVRARSAMARLPEDYREALRLTTEAGLTYAEAGERMGRTPEAVRKLCGRAICRFREIYRGLGGGRHGG